MTTTTATTAMGNSDTPATTVDSGSEISTGTSSRGGDVENPKVSSTITPPLFADHMDKSEKSIREITGEKDLVRKGSRAVYVVLIATGLTLSLATFLFLTNAREKEFQSEFHSYARVVSDIADSNVEHTFDLLNSLATSLTSRAIESSSEDGGDAAAFPNVTTSYFDHQAKGLVESTTSGVEMVMYLPFVEEQTRDGWEHYMNDKFEFGDEQYYRQIFTCEHCETVTDERLGFANKDSFMEGILEDHGYQTEGLSVPIAQYGPRATTSNEDDKLAMMDLLSHPIFKKELVASLEYDIPVLSEATDLNFLLDLYSTGAATGGSEAGNKDSFRSFTVSPVKENFNEDARTVGFVVGIVPWSAFFANCLVIHDHHTSVQGTPEPEINGIVTKVVSDCGETFTYTLNGGKNNTAVAGDNVEMYEGYEHIVDINAFFSKHDDSAVGGSSRQCHFGLHIHPSDDFYEPYENATPMMYAGLVLCVFLFTAVTFCIYESFVFDRQREVVSHATSMVIENARQAAKNERDLNDFIAHEVRNPLAAAMTACSFVSTAIVEDEGATPLIRLDEKRKSVQEDIQIIDSSLHFINDLLRNMLDMQRASSNQMSIETKPTHILDDIFQPTVNMLHVRDVNFKVELRCPANLVVMTDPLRLKQIILNLARNAVKFVDHGFIRLRAKVILEPGGAKNVELSVEDSGPGIPTDKCDALFGKFQESLDSLNQGTGIGLNLCKKLTDLMGAHLYIDQKYYSGIDGCPGTRFAINMNQSPIDLDDAKLAKFGDESMRTTASVRTRSTRSLLGLGGSTNSLLSDLSSVAERESETYVSESVNPDNLSPVEELPEVLNVLFVDDDMVLRKLFARSLKKTVPKWNVKEAANGETALQITKEHHFDLIFVDQYMASVQKQLLGTETTRALRSQGVTATICGLSANDVENAFFEAGADGFMFKPFPCKPDLLKIELHRIISEGKSAGRTSTPTTSNCAAIPLDVASATTPPTSTITKNSLTNPPTQSLFSLAAPAPTKSLFTLAT